VDAWVGRRLPGTTKPLDRSSLIVRARPGDTGRTPAGRVGELADSGASQSAPQRLLRGTDYTPPARPGLARPGLAPGLWTIGVPLLFDGGTVSIPCDFSQDRRIYD